MWQPTKPVPPVTEDPHPRPRRYLRLPAASMRVWVDITNSPHAVIFRPLIARMRARGHEVTVTSREFAQTVGLLDRFGIEHTVVGAHGGASRRGKARAMARPLGRAGALRPRASASTSPSPTAAPTSPWRRACAGTPQVTMFDYEFAATMHHWNGRLASRVLVPAAIPEEALARYGMRPPKLVRYPGPEGGVLPRRPRGRPGGRRRAGPRPRARRSRWCARRPRSRSTTAAPSTDLFAATLARLLAAAPEVQTVVLPRTDEQRRALEGRAAVVPARGDRRPQPGGRRRRGRQRRRHDEPRGRRPGRARLHARSPRAWGRWTGG